MPLARIPYDEDEAATLSRAAARCAAHGVAGVHDEGAGGPGTSPGLPSSASRSTSRSRPTRSFRTARRRVSSRSRRWVPTANRCANMPLRAEIRVDNVPTDFGSLSARNLVTDANGRATLVYTAPATVPGAAIDTQTVVQIGVTAASGDAANAVTRFANLRLLPPGRVGPPSDLPLSFTTGTPSTGEVAAQLAFAVIPPRARRSSATTGTSVMAHVATTQVPSASHAYMQSGSFVLSVVPRTRSVAPGPRPGRLRSPSRRRRRSTSPSRRAIRRRTRSSGSTPRDPSPLRDAASSATSGTLATARRVPECRRRRSTARSGPIR